MAPSVPLPQKTTSYVRAHSIRDNKILDDDPTTREENFYTVDNECWLTICLRQLTFLFNNFHSIHSDYGPLLVYITVKCSKWPHSAAAAAALGSEVDHFSSAYWMNWSKSGVYRLRTSSYALLILAGTWASHYLNSVSIIKMYTALSRLHTSSLKCTAWKSGIQSKTQISLTTSSARKVCH